MRGLGGSSLCLLYSIYRIIQEGFVVVKTDLNLGEINEQYYIINRPKQEWNSADVVNRILLHWETETGVFGIKDRTLKEDDIRYFSINGAMSHVSLLNFSWNCLSTPIFNELWKGESMNYRIQFFKDHVDYNPFN